MKHLLLILLLTGCSVNHNFDDIDVNVVIDVSQIRQACEEALPFAPQREIGQCVLDEMDLLGINFSDIDQTILDEILDQIENGEE